MKVKDTKDIRVPELSRRHVGAIHRAQSVKYLLRAVVDKKRAMLVIAFYAREGCQGNCMHEPEIILYQSKTDYLARVSNGGKGVWKTGCLTKILASMCESWRWDPIEACVFLTKREEKSVASFVGKQNCRNSILSSVIALQEQIKSDRLKAKHDRIMARIDDRMASVPDLPRHFSRWVEQSSPLKSSRYFFLHRVSSRKWSGYCTFCGADVELEKVKHKERAVCPACGTHATIKTRGKMGNFVDIKYASLLQKSLAGEVILRLFQLTRAFSKSRHVETTCFEYGRFFFGQDGKLTGSYKWKRFKNTDSVRWSEASEHDWTPSHSYWNNPLHAYHDCPLYPWGISRALSGTPLQYFAKDLIRNDIRKKHTVMVLDNIEFALSFPFVELFQKLGAIKLYHEFLICSSLRRKFSNLGGSNLKEIFGLTRYHVQQMIRLNMGIQEFAYLVDTCCVQLSDENFVWASSYLDSKFFMLLLKHTTIHKIRRYTECHYKQRHLWQNYVDDCVKLGYDLKNESVLYPRNLKARRDAILELVKIKKNEMINGMIAGRYEALKDRYSYSDNRYLLIPPQNLDEMIREGNELHHCVGTNYSQFHAEGVCNIFFVRKIEAPDMPYATIELRYGCIRQCYGFNHSSMPQIQGFLDNWLRAKVVSLQKVV